MIYVIIAVYVVGLYLMIVEDRSKKTTKGN